MIHILYENPDWLPPLVAGLEAEQLEYRLVEVWKGELRIDGDPPEGVWLNRMSPSSHTRGHGTSVGLMREWLAWLESAGRRVVNGSSAFRLEVSKVQQDIALRRWGIKTPRTVAGVGREALLSLASTFEGPFITKHNQGGKGLGIHLFDDVDGLEAHLDGDQFDPGPDGVIVLQQYIRPREPFITRVELVGGRFLYAMRSSTEQGFELCPSDACQLPTEPSPPSLGDVCPIDGGSKFTASPMTADDPLVDRYRGLCTAHGIEVAGIEFVEGADGERYTYDINGTTNYNSGVGEQVGVDGMREVARYLGSLAGES